MAAAARHGENCAGMCDVRGVCGGVRLGLGQRGGGDRQEERRAHGFASEVAELHVDDRFIGATERHRACCALVSSKKGEVYGELLAILLRHTRYEEEGPAAAQSPVVPAPGVQGEAPVGDPG